MKALSALAFGLALISVGFGALAVHETVRIMAWAGEVLG